MVVGGELLHRGEAIKLELDDWVQYRTASLIESTVNLNLKSANASTNTHGCLGSSLYLGHCYIKEYIRGSSPSLNKRQ